MSALRKIEITASPLGQGNPYHVGEHKNYRWRGDPAKSEAARAAGPRRARDSATAAPNVRRAEKQQRYERFCQLRDEGMDVIPAGREVGVERRAAARYEKQRREERQDRG